MTQAERKTVKFSDYIDTTKSQNDVPLNQKTPDSDVSKREPFLPIRVEKEITDKGKEEFRFKYPDGDEGIRWFLDKLEETGGVPDWTFGLTVLQQCMNASTRGNDKKAVRKQNAVSSAMLNIAPGDAIEGMLACQITAVHNHIMECLQQAMCFHPDPGAEQAASFRNQAARLMRVFASHVECLNRYQRKGTQKVVVEHVERGEHKQG